MADQPEATELGKEEHGEDTDDLPFSELAQISGELKDAVQEAVGDLKSAALHALDREGLHHALKALAPQVRKQILGELGLYGGRKPDLAVTALALQKLRTAHPRFQEWAA